MRRKSIINTMTIEDFKHLVESSYSISEILDKLGFSKASGSMSKIVKERILKENLSISHFNKGNRSGGKPSYSLEEILVEDSKYDNIYRLKTRLVNEGMLEYKCQICGNTGEWNAKKLVLELDHINGKHNDHRLCNLRFLCPNCHSQTDTNSGKNADKSKIWTDRLAS